MVEIAGAPDLAGGSIIQHLHLRLHGVERDRQRLKRLSARLLGLGLSNSVTLWRTDREVRSRAPAPPAEGNGKAAVQDAFCWTRNGVCANERSFHAFAVECKERGSYLGLILDDLTPPAVVTGAEDVKLVGWDGEEGRDAVMRLMDFLRTRQEGLEASRATGLSGGIERILAAIMQVYGRLRRVYLISFLSFLIAAFTFLGSWQSNWAGACQLWGIHNLCGWFGWGSVATAAETREWKAIEKTSECAVLQQYLDRRGHSAPFSAVAENRIKLQRPADGVRTNSTRLEIPYWTQGFSVDRKSALGRLEKSADAQARELCATHAKTFIGLARPPIFARQTEPTCLRDAEGHRCGYRIEVICAFRVKGDHMICPP